MIPKGMIPEGDEPIEIALVGDLTDEEGDLSEKLLDVPIGGECTIYFDSPGGSPYTAISLLTLIAIRDIKATGIVTGECSSSALWPLAACQRRFVSRYSVLLFHPIKWQSEEQVHRLEASEWARHFGTLEQDMDDLLADFLRADRKLIAEWMTPGKYVSGAEFAQHGFAELYDLKPKGN